MRFRILLTLLLSLPPVSLRAQDASEARFKALEDQIHALQEQVQALQAALTASNPAAAPGGAPQPALAQAAAPQAPATVPAPAAAPSALPGESAPASLPVYGGAGSNSKGLHPVIHRLGDFIRGVGRHPLNPFSAILMGPKR